MDHEFIETPSIDKLASESLTFTRGYATAPLCSPSLASIITGYYAFQHGMTGNDPVVQYEGPKHFARSADTDTLSSSSYPVQRNIAYQKLSANFYKKKLITQTLADQGYLSFQSGKWWVGSAEDAGFSKGMTHGDFTKGDLPISTHTNLTVVADAKDCGRSNSALHAGSVGLVLRFHG